MIGTRPAKISRGDRIAQLVVQRVERARVPAGGRAARRPARGPVGTARPAGTPVSCRRPVAERDDRAADGRKRWQGECEQRRVGAVIFSRKRADAGRHARDERATEVLDEARGEPAPAHRGPYDSPRRPTSVQRLDLGSLQIPAVAGRRGAGAGRPAGRDPAGRAGPRRQRAAARRLRGAAHRGHLGRGARGDPPVAAQRRRRRPGGRRASTAPSCAPGCAPRRARPTCGSSASTGRAGWSGRLPGPGGHRPGRAPGRSPSAWTAWWSTGARRRSRSASRCRCACPGRWPSQAGARAPADAGRRAGPRHGLTDAHRTRRSRPRDRRYAGGTVPASPAADRAVARGPVSVERVTRRS